MSASFGSGTHGYKYVKFFNLHDEFLKMYVTDEGNELQEGYWNYGGHTASNWLDQYLNTGRLAV